MRKNIVILLRILIGFAGFLVLLLIERAGIPYKAAEGNSLVVDNDLITYHKESSKDKTCLYIMDSGDENSVLASENLKQILMDMRVPYEVYDIAQGIPDPTGYDKVIMGIKHLTAFGEKILDYADYVEDGGKVLFWLPLEREETLDIITGKLGITDIDFNNIEVDYFDPKDDFMLGSNNTPFFLVDYYPSSMQVNLDDLSEVFATCGSTPLIWRKKYGDGYFVVCNFGYCEKAYRGIYSAAYSLLDDVCIYPVINGATFYLDDFPSPVPKGDGTYIRRDYDMDIAEFYTNVWWPDLLSLGNEYNFQYTGLVIETYENQVSGELKSNTDVADYYYYGNMLLNAGGELGYHGYNHQPLCDNNFEYKTELGYKKWESQETIRDALTEVIEFSEGLFPTAKLQVYVPPSNILSKEGLAIIDNEYPKITTVASIYLSESDAYSQEFDVDESGMINTPRIVSGGVKDSYMRFAAFSELNFHLVASHFMHPDDLLDIDRGADLGWESVKSVIEEYMVWLNESAPPMRHLTGSGMAGAVQRFTNIVIDIDQRDDGITINTEGLIDTAYCLVRVNRGQLGSVTGGALTYLKGDLYLLEIKEDVVEIEYRK
ncbi:hypothetical protein SAMN02745229_03961 [Butyrivibrio fibrisolvens DSM 3071]|uniref:DUF2194 domain-containing protein n=1 Tax=Butyrivibrio fibrisolvens DSM 3071 TaxID=1121131 RepID=A0A1M6FRU3_BUTFI|nr:DUF2194 domain-containing protein [Butyrivibrio fibrisolvens]SHJ00406.1 hypothetical protein SAMN02745229_03961 [Butyrivibrio fibrisolvens DSM 3071]